MPKIHNFNINELGISSDDLSGACDVSLYFLDVVGEVNILNTLEGNEIKNGILNVVNTQTRGVCKEKSFHINSEVGRAFFKKRIVLKKIDSGMRGHILEEINGIVNTYCPDKIVFAPAIPEIGRITKNGVQYIGNKKIHETVLSQDIGYPIKSSNIHDYVENINGINICDAENEAELDKIVEKNLDFNKVLFVGSLGIAKALSKKVRREKYLYAKKSVKSFQQKRSIVISGSQHPRAINQMKYASKKKNIRLFEIIDNSFNFHEIIKCEKEILLFQFKIQDENKKKVREALKRISKKIISAIKPTGIGFIGGETAFDVLSNFGEGSIVINKKITEILAGGLMKNDFLGEIFFSIKGGSVGEINSVEKMINFLERGKYE